MIKKSLLILMAVNFLFPQLCFSLISIGRGSDPVHDRGWPAGCVEVANLSSRLGWSEGPLVGGQCRFLYRCGSTSEFNEALKIFAAIGADRLELVVHNGPEYSFWLKQNDEELSKAENRVDWTFTVWVQKNWDRLYNNSKNLFLSDQPNFRKPVAAPRIDIYIGSGSIVWKDVKVPKNVVVIEKRPGSVSPEFAGAGLVQSKVFDMVTGRPISGAEIILTKYQAKSGEETVHGKTNEQGLCQIGKISPGYYAIGVKAKGFVARKLGRYDNKRPEYHKFDVGLARPSYLKGVITDIAGNPIKGIKVSARNIISSDGFGYPCLDDISATSDKQGLFEIRDLPMMGSANIHCDTKSFHMTNSIFEVYTIGSDTIKLIMTGTGIIQGKVVGSDGKRPSGQIVLEIKHTSENQLGKWGCSRYLSEDGTFDISGIPPGRYIISTRANPSNANYKPSIKEITVEPGKTYKIEITHK